MKKLNSTKGQMTLGDAPSVVLIVGLVFLVMATVALIGDKFGEAVLPTGTGSGTIANESVTFNALNNPISLSVYNVRDVVCISPPTQLINDSAQGANLLVGNVTLTSDCTLINTTAVAGAGWIGNGTVYVSYAFTYTPETVAFNTTADLQTEISNNTSIAGIVLTISLVGIVLSILIGVFLGVTRRSNRV